MKPVKSLLAAFALLASCLYASAQIVLPGAGSGATLAGLPPSYYLSGNWYFPAFLTAQSSGSATTANTIYCFYGGVTAKVTIKTLGLYLVTGITTDTLQLAIYSQSGGTLTLVDNTGNIAAGTGQSGSAINGGLSNTTDVLSPGVLYAFCENSPGAMVFEAVPSVSFQGLQAVFIGSATQSSLNGTGSFIEGRSISQTYTSGWPGTITESSMADVTTSLTPLISFQVN